MCDKCISQMGGSGGSSTVLNVIYIAYMAALPLELTSVASCLLTR